MVAELAKPVDIGTGHPRVVVAPGHAYRFEVLVASAHRKSSNESCPSAERSRLATAAGPEGYPCPLHTLVVAASAHRSERDVIGVLVLWAAPSTWAA
jgi:hypothetical protein